MMWKLVLAILASVSCYMFSNCWLFDALENSDLYNAIQLFFEYDIYEYYMACTHENLEIYYIYLGRFFIGILFGSYICMALEYGDCADYHEWLWGPWAAIFGIKLASLLQLLEGPDIVADIQLSYLVSSPSTTPTARVKPPSITPTAPMQPPSTFIAPDVAPAFPFKNFRGTGDSFLPRNRYKLEKNHTTQHPIAVRSFSNEEEESKKGSRQVPDVYGVYDGWAVTEPTATEKLAVLPQVEAPVSPQQAVKFTQKSSMQLIAAEPTEKVAEQPFQRLPAPIAVPFAPAVSSVPDFSSMALVTRQSFSAPIFVQPVQSIQLVHPVQHIQPVQTIQPAQPVQLLPPPPPTFELVCSELAMKRGELKDALFKFMQVVDHFGDVSNEIISLGKRFDRAYQELRFHRNSLRLEESNTFGWAEYISDFYLKIHPHVGVLGTNYNQDMLCFLRALLQFGRYLGLKLPDLDLSPPPAPVLQQVVPPAMMQLAPVPAVPQQATSMKVASVAAVPQQVKPLKVAQVTVALPARAPETPRPAVPEQATPMKAAHVPLAVSARAPEMPQPALTTSAAPAKSPMPSAPATLDFDNLMGWHDKSEEQLLELTFASFGWTNENAGKIKIWSFSAAQDLALRGSPLDWTRIRFVKNELVRTGRGFKRASAVLRMQAVADDLHQHDVSLAPLLSDLVAFVKNAKTMIETCLGANKRGFDTPETFNMACCFFHNEIRAEEKIQTALRRQYGRDRVRALAKQWDEVADVWLPDD